VNLNNPLIRLLVMVVAVAATLRITWLLIRPVLPALAVTATVFGVLWLVRWWRDERW
jgi:hypothetical protein